MRTWNEIKAIIDKTEEGSTVLLTKKEKEAFGEKLALYMKQQSCNHVGCLVPYKQVFGVRKYNISSINDPNTEAIMDYHSGPSKDACCVITASVICTKCFTVIDLPNPESLG